ncbi:hypothetical protein Rctr197k_192 [Virus Rctr197k]|nr:hypothetical protein Rctr197k_192 [Virus Rctr197k]
MIRTVAQRRSAEEKELGPAQFQVRWVYRDACLKCYRPFRAPNRFLRLCESCRRRAAELYQPQYEGW